MVYFYTEGLSFMEAAATYLLLLLPITIFYLTVIKYCYPLQINKNLLVTGIPASLMLNLFYSAILFQYYPDIGALSNTFNIVTYFIIIVLFHFISQKKNHSFLVGLIVVTILCVLTANLFEYIRIYLLTFTENPFFSLYLINWYLLPFLVFLPLFKKVADSIQKMKIKQPSIVLSILCFLWIALLVFTLLIQVISVTHARGEEPYTTVIFLSNSFIGKAFIEQLSPSSKILVNHIEHIYTIATIVLVICILLILSFLALIQLNKKKTEALLVQKKTEYELIQYTKTLEVLTKNIRKNHHDFDNLLISLGGYIYNDPVDMDALKKYYAEISNTFEQDYQYFSEISKLHNLKITELKTLIYSKLMAATKKSISFTVEIDEPINELLIDSLDISRICGILIDNALEAAEECEEPAVRLAFIVTQDAYVLMIVNTTQHTHADSLMEKDDFSTKGAGRGLGLSIVRQLIQKYVPFLTLETKQQNHFVYQTLTVKKEMKK